MLRYTDWKKKTAGNIRKFSGHRAEIRIQNLCEYEAGYVDVKLHPFWNSAPNRSEWSGS
jgi:hypothetical protein